MPGFKKRSIKGYRRSKNVQDMRNADFIAKSEMVRRGRIKERSPVPQTFKEPLEWQHDDRTDATNARTYQEKGKFLPFKKVKIKYTKEI